MIRSIIRGILEALLPFLFKKDPTHAEDSIQVDRDLRSDWASRINRRMQEFKSKSGTGSSDDQSRRNSD